MHIVPVHLSETVDLELRSTFQSSDYLLWTMVYRLGPCKILQEVEFRAFYCIAASGRAFMSAQADW